MSNHLQSKIFLSYSRQNEGKVSELYKRLKQEGYDPWIDTVDLLPGQNWQEAISKAIWHSAIFIACLSKDSINSEGYAQRELRMGLNRCADKPPGSIYIIPLRLDDCTIPDLRQNDCGITLREYHWVNYFEEDGFERLTKALEHQFAHLTSNSQTAELVRPFKGGDYQERLSSETCLHILEVPSGKFMMGSPQDECGRFGSESPQHEVTVPSFMMSKHPVTQAQWQAVAALPKIEKDMDATPCLLRGSLYPVVQVSWYEAQEFCLRLSEYAKRTYRLPSEAEWEYACRAGTTTPFYFGETMDRGFSNCSGYEVGTIKVTAHQPNPFGLYDMHGNVSEWCQDVWHDSYDGSPTNGSAWIEGHSSDRVIRGGSFKNSGFYCRSASRSRAKTGFRRKDVGFRVCCSVS